MTREQVLINHIQEYLDSGMWQYEACYLNKDDLKVIIKALEQEPCEDAISRQAVLDAIEDDNRNGMWSCFVSDDDAQKFKTVIKELPSVKQEPILDKIRAEIECLTYYWCEVNPRTVIDDALQIIDKYKAESEEKE